MSVDWFQTVELMKTNNIAAISNFMMFGIHSIESQTRRFWIYESPSERNTSSADTRHSNYSIQQPKRRPIIEDSERDREEQEPKRFHNQTWFRGDEKPRAHDFFDHFSEITSYSKCRKDCKQLAARVMGFRTASVSVYGPNHQRK